MASAEVIAGDLADFMLGVASDRAAKAADEGQRANFTGKQVLDVKAFLGFHVMETAEEGAFAAPHAGGEHFHEPGSPVCNASGSELAE